jgi:hypothetical protein
MAAKARRGQPRGDLFNQIGAAGDISAGGAQSAARIFDQGAGDQIGATIQGSRSSTNSP